MTEYRGLTEGELDGLFGWLTAYRTLVIAVSGGPDSMALCALLERWCERLGDDAPALVAVTVDHGLRADSADEAAIVAKRVRTLGLAHRVLRWEGEKPRTAIQEMARQERYRLLATAAKGAAAQPSAVVTAHHADDQAETLLMRLVRGSGVDGLAGMAPLRFESGVPIARPLLSIPKSRLQSTLAERGIDWVEDPSNANPAFERVRLRSAWPHIEAAGLSADMLSLSAGRLRRARAALERMTDELALRALDEHAGAYASIDRAAWLAAEEELRVRLLMRVLVDFGGQEEPPGLGQVEELASALALEAFPGASLGGCLIETRPDTVAIYREPGRTGLPQLELAPGETGLWDRRFEVIAPPDAAETVHVRALGAEQFARLRQALDTPMPARAGRTLPSIWHRGEPVAVPSLGHEAGSIAALWRGLRCVYRPRHRDLTGETGENAPL